MADFINQIGQISFELPVVQPLSVCQSLRYAAEGDWSTKQKAIY